jgi:hypothetical protein
MMEVEPRQVPSPIETKSPVVVEARPESTHEMSDSSSTPSTPRTTELVHEKTPEPIETTPSISQIPPPKEDTAMEPVDSTPSSPAESEPASKPTTETVADVFESAPSSPDVEMPASRALESKTSSPQTSEPSSPTIDDSVLSPPLPGTSDSTDSTPQTSEPGSPIIETAVAVAAHPVLAKIGTSHAQSDSMVTVNLSETSDGEDTEHETVKNETPVQRPEITVDTGVANSRPSSLEILSMDSAKPGVLANSVHESEPPTPASVASQHLTVERSRSNSNDSDKSAVDWEQLDRTEEKEQEQVGETSNEVR